MGLAERLDAELHQPVATALADGRLRVDQADVITRAVDSLPIDLVDAATRSRARDVLLANATDHDARALRVLGKRVLDVVAPQVGEAHEQRVLEAEEARAAASASFTLADDGTAAATVASRSRASTAGCCASTSTPSPHHAAHPELIPSHPRTCTRRGR